MRTSEGVFECGDLSLQRGGTLTGARIVYKTFGTLSPKRDNVILYPTSYSAHHTDIEWLVKVEHCLDPSRYFIVIPNMFTNGLSSSPSNTPAALGEFPKVTTYDNVTQQRRLLNELFGVDRVKMVYGWSMGALQAYHWAALYPEMVERAVVVCGSARTADHNKVFLSGLLRTLEAAPEHTGNGRFSSEPLLALNAGVAIAGSAVHFVEWPWSLRGGVLPWLDAAEGLPPSKLPGPCATHFWTSWPSTASASGWQPGARTPDRWVHQPGWSTP